MNEPSETRLRKLLRYTRTENINEEAYILSIKKKNRETSSVFSQAYHSKQAYDKKRLDMEHKIQEIGNQDLNTKEYTKDRTKIKIMASMVPDEIIYNFSNYECVGYYAALMFADISGFTDLCEKYTKTGKDGTSRMTQVLNSYIGAMVQKILSHNGDLLKFSGDAFLAMWKSTPQISMQNAVQAAIDCALIIQRNYGIVETDVGVVLRVKVAISGGRVQHSMIGDKENSHYAVVGQPVWDVKKAEHMSKAGDVIASPSAWKYVNPAQYITKLMDDDIHTNILGIGATWENIGGNTFDIWKRSLSEHSVIDENLIDLPISTDLYSQNIELLIQAYTDKSISNIRQSVDFAMQNNIMEPFRRFMLMPVMRAIENDESMEYLTEMRYVVILFLNVITEITDGKLLLSVVDKAYKDVCRLVKLSNGIVNKLSLFDKDMMFLVVFGLRGMKHEMEKNYALNCAVDLHNSLNKHKHIKLVSIGVTSGLAYCGVVGHKLRREYTVLGLCVNKGARLMVAYPGKITCDMEVYLQSKIGENYFGLMEFKVLKGLSNVGPVYEYNGKQISQMTKYIKPLAGRSHELGQFALWLNKLLECDRLNLDRQSRFSLVSSKLLIIQGEATIGKMRLLDGMIHVAQKSLTIYKIILTNRNKNISYYFLKQLILQGLYSIFNGEVHKNKIEEEKIQHLVGSAIPKDKLAFVNEALQVHFLKNDFYYQSPISERNTICLQNLQIICDKLFTSPYLIAVHTAECIDDASWASIEYVLNSNLIGMLLTVEEYIEQQSNLFSGILANHKFAVMHLGGISRWHHSTIICQILDVQAVSPKLEKIVQVYSQGLLGWIEKFIQILIQSGQLSIRSMTKEQAFAIGAVMPISDDMRLFDLTNNDTDKGWSMFQSSYRSVQSDTEDAGGSKDFNENTIRVAILKPTYKFESMQIEVGSNVTFLKTYDNLKPFEKLQLKCSSALGEMFNRKLLMKILKFKSELEAAIGFAKLFDVGFLECAGGDFTQEESTTFVRPVLAKTKENFKKCHCIGIKIPQGDNDLPYYAWCGYMRFCNTMFFTYAYDLLTESRKKEFHESAINLLVKDIRKCRACGMGKFNKLLGVKKEVYTEKDEISENFVTYLNDGGFNFKYFTTKPESDYVYFGESFVDGRGTMSVISRWSRSSGSLFIMGNFADCECEMILAGMYSQIINHCKLSGRIHTLLEAYIEYAELKINDGNIQEAMVVLSEVDEFVHSPKFYVNENNKEFMAWLMNFVFGRISSIRGRAFLEYGDFGKAKKYLFKAMTLFDHPFPTTRNSMKVKQIWEKSKLILSVEIFPHFFVGGSSGIQAIFEDQIAETLSYLFKYFMTLKNYEDAYLAAVWSLNMALKSNNNFGLLCIANSNMIEIGKRFNEVRLCTTIEYCAMKMCSKMKQCLDVTEVYAVTQLFTNVFLFRLVYLNVESGIEIGFNSLKTMCKSKNRHFRALVLIALSGVLVSKKLFQDVMEIYNELRLGDDQDVYSRTWYYANALNLQLDTGYTVEISDSYCRFYMEHGENLINVKDPVPGWHFIISLWVRSLRMKEWDTSAAWFEKAQHYADLVLLKGSMYMPTALRFFEGVLLMVVTETDEKSEYEYTISLDYVEKIYKCIELTCRYNKLHWPKFLFLKAYYYHVIYNDHKMVKKYLEECKMMGGEVGIDILNDWCTHMFKALNNTLSPLERDYWIIHSQPGKEIFLNGVEALNKIFTPFTFPSPKNSFY